MLELFKLEIVATYEKSGVCHPERSGMNERSEVNVAESKDLHEFSNMQGDPSTSPPFVNDSVIELQGRLRSG
jgi:hypothetical protein